MSYLNPDTDKVKTETETHEMNFFALNRYVERMLGETLGEKKIGSTLPRLDETNSVYIGDLRVLPTGDVEFIPNSPEAY